METEINKESIAIPEKSKSRKLQELIETQTKKFNLPAIKNLPVTEDSIAIKRQGSTLKVSNNVIGSKTLYCKFFVIGSND